MMTGVRLLSRGLRPVAALVLAVTILVPAASAQPQPADAKRPMTFLDVQKMRTAGSLAPSPDGKLLLYTISTPDWKEAKRQSDIHLVSLEKGVSSTRQMTFTKDKNESEPKWLKDGVSFIFASNREAPASAATQNQLYLMRIDGGEAKKITEAKEGVTTFALSKDGKWLVYRSGKAGEEQLYRLPTDTLDLAVPEALTKQAAGIGAWKWAPDGTRIYFTGPETADADEKARREKKFTVDIRNAETPLASLWAVDIEPRKVTRLTNDSTITVAAFKRRLIKRTSATSPDRWTRWRRWRLNSATTSTRRNKNQHTARTIKVTATRVQKFRVVRLRPKNEPP